MKQTNFLKSFFLLCALIVGSVSAWGATYNFSSLPTTGWTTSGGNKTINSKTWTYSSSTYIGCNGSRIQIGSQNNPQTSAWTISIPVSSFGSGKAIKNVTITAYTTAASATYDISVGGTSYSGGSLTTSSSNYSTGNINVTTGSIVVTMTGSSTSKAMYLSNISVTYDDAKTLDHITLSGTYPTSFTEQDEFSHEGMTVTANYEDSSSKDVTSSATFTGYDMDEIGNQTVTVSYTEGNTTKTATYDITINAGEKYTVSFDPEAGTCGTASLTESAYKGGVTLPAATTGVAGWELAGWAADAVDNTTTQPTLYKAGSTYYPTSATVLHAVYTLSETSSTFVRVTSINQVEFAKSIVVVKNSDNFVLNHSRTAGVAAPEESAGEITAPANTIFALTGDNSDGFVLTGENGTLSQTTVSTSGSNDRATDWSGDNNQWKIEANAYATNTFALSNSTNVALEYYSGWKTEYNTSYNNRQYTAMKLYVPKSVYDSTPSALIIPTVAFDSADPVILYLDGTKTNTNTATVTGVSKTINYSSSNTSVATVTSEGVVTAKGIGTTTITASVDAELGVSAPAYGTYKVTVKNTTTIAGLKALYNAAQSPAKAFAADLTDAVVTYVSGNHAYIQDASGAIYASCGSSLTAGKKINGAVSGTITAPYTIDEIKTIDLSAATVTEDGVIPEALTKTVAEVKENAAALDGQLVTINAVTIDKPSTTTTLRDGSKIGEEEATITMYSPNGVASVTNKEKGNFTGYISFYNGNTPRINLYEQSQFTKTHNAPQNQVMSFTKSSYNLDEETDAVTSFAGQEVTKTTVKGAVTYAITGDAIGTVNAETGVVTLNGDCGTATIVATAAYAEEEDEGIITPYPALSKEYTVTVRPRYSVTFSVNGIETVLRQSTSGATIAVPTPGDLGDYTFMGWSTSTVDPTDDAPSMTDLGATVIPTDNDDKYYAVYAQERAGGEENRTSEFVIKTSSTPSNPIVIDGVSWTYSDVDFANTASAGMPENSTVTFALPNDALNAVSVEITSTSNTWASSTKLSLPLTDKDDNVLTTLYKDNYSYNFTSTDNKVGPYTITSTTTDSKKAYIDHITVTYAIIGTENYDYRTSLPNVEVTISESKFLSFCYGSKLDFSETDVKAYKASVDGEGKVTLTKVDVVPAGEGVVLYCETPDTYSIPVTTKDASDVTGNEMVGVLVRTQVVWNPTTGIYNYILQQGQFNKATDGYLKPNRAYLSTSYDVTPLGAKALSVVFAEDETDGIRSIENSRIENSDYYNLAGQKVGADYKGVVIVNGKKYMRK